MKELEFIELIKTPRIRDFLIENNVYLDEKEFIENILKNKQKIPKIYAAHQVSVDYKWSNVAKFVDLINLKKKYSIAADIILSDIDQPCNKTIDGTVGVHWPFRLNNQGVNLVSKKNRNAEIRFINIREVDFQNFILSLKQSTKSTDSFEQKIEDLKKIYELSAGNLASFNYMLSKKIINHYLKNEMTYLLAHEMILKKKKIMQIIANKYIEYNVKFNMEINTINQLIPHLGLRTRRENELPFFMTCSNDYYRNRLCHRTIENKIYGIATCKICDREIMINFDNLSEADVNYLSPDISSLIYTSDEYDGYVGGISSAIYIIILNNISRQLLNTPVKPTLIPPSLFNKCAEFREHDSLFYNFIYNK